MKNGGESNPSLSPPEFATGFSQGVAAAILTAGSVLRTESAIQTACPFPAIAAA
jgi:malonyl CoA-acyl carrier protein transacylase